MDKPTRAFPPTQYERRRLSYRATVAVIMFLGAAAVAILALVIGVDW